MKFLKQLPEICDELEPGTTEYIESGIKEILEKESIKGKVYSKYQEIIFLVWLNLEYREQTIQKLKVKEYIKSNYDKQNTKEEIKDKYKDKHGQMLFPFNKETILQLKEDYQLSAGHHVISNSIHLLIKYAVIDPVWGSNYLNEKGDLKSLLLFTPDNIFIPKPDYYKEIHNQKGYMTKLLYRPRNIHLLNGNKHYEDIRGGEYVNIHLKDKEKTKVKEKVKTVNAEKVTYINQESRFIRISYKGSGINYNSVFVNDTNHGGRLYSNIQNMPSKQRDVYLAHAGFNDKFDVVSAKFRVYFNLAGQKLDYDPYLHIALSMGYGIEWAKEHREAFKACSQVMLESGNLNYYQKIKAISYALAKRGLIISSNKYGSNQSKQWEGILSKDDLIQAVNSNKVYDYTNSVKNLVDLKFNNKPDNRVVSGKMKSFINKKMNKEDFYFNDENTYIVNRTKKGSIESVVIYSKNGECEEIPASCIANEVMKNQSVTTALNINSYRKEHSIKSDYQEVNAHHFLETFIKEYESILPFINSNLIDYSYIESNLTIDIMVNLFKKGIQTINIHDGFYCKREEKEEVEKEINYYYSKEVFFIVNRLINKINNEKRKENECIEKTRKNNYRYKGQYLINGLIEVEGMYVDDYGEIVEYPSDKEEIAC